MTAPGLVSVRDAAAYLSCSPQHVYDLIAAGRLRSTDIGIGRAQTRIRRTDLDLYVEANTRRAN
jgi:excisionase family DNA binding protein